MLRVQLIAALGIILICFLSAQGMYGEDLHNAIYLAERSPASVDSSFEQEFVIAYSFEEPDNSYSETQLRRFEIIFFISLPASVIFTLAGIGAFRAGTRLSGNLRPVEYQYLVLSACGISLSIALRDNRVVYRKGGIQ